MIVLVSDFVVQRMLWFTQSKAFAKSVTTTSICWPLSRLDVSISGNSFCELLHDGRCFNGNHNPSRYESSALLISFLLISLGLTLKDTGTQVVVDLLYLARQFSALEYIHTALLSHAVVNE